MSHGPTTFFAGTSCDWLRTPSVPSNTAAGICICAAKTVQQVESPRREQKKGHATEIARPYFPGQIIHGPFAGAKSWKSLLTQSTDAQRHTIFLIPTSDNLLNENMLHLVRLHVAAPGAAPSRHLTNEHYDTQCSGSSGMIGSYNMLGPLYRARQEGS
jgi:hypothetical protein